MLNWNLHSFKLLEIIQVLDSISWVRCASGNVFFAGSLGLNSRRGTSVDNFGNISDKHSFVR